MNKHTPGPWEAEVLDKVSYQITSGHRLIAELFIARDAIELAVNGAQP